MALRVMILNGPNLNLLGSREPHIYGSVTLAAIKASCRQFAESIGAAIAFHQSNHEGALIDWVHAARDQADAIIVDPAGFSFTSVALLDALKTFAGRIVDACPTAATGTAGREAALDMIAARGRGITVGADKGYDAAELVAECRALGCTPRLAQNVVNRRSAVDGRTTRHPGYAVSQQKRKRIEEPFGWFKTTGGLRKTRHCGRAPVERFLMLTAAAYNLIRIPKLLAATGRVRPKQPTWPLAKCAYRLQRQ